MSGSTKNVQLGQVFHHPSIYYPVQATHFRDEGNPPDIDMYIAFLNKQNKLVYADYGDEGVTHASGVDFSVYVTVVQAGVIDLTPFFG